MSTSDAYLDGGDCEASGSRRRRYVLFQFRQHLLNIILAGKSVHDLQLGKLDVDWIVVLAEKHLDVILEDSWPSLNYEQDVPQSDILNLRSRGQQRYLEVTTPSTDRTARVQYTFT